MRGIASKSPHIYPPSLFMCQNVYFLLIAVLQSWPAVSTTNGTPTTLMPLLFVYLVSLAREVYEEVVRRREQSTVNVSNKARVWRSGEGAGREVSWQDIRVGDIVRCENDSFLPCDLVLLGVVHKERAGEVVSESARRAKIGSCHVDTASLDGESNLKKFSAVSAEVADFVQDESAIPRLKVRVHVGPSMRELGKFDGRLDVLQSFSEPNAGGALVSDMAEAARAGSGSSVVEIRASTKGNAHVLLRECKIRNCAHVYGLAIYTGPETFIQQQSKMVDAKAVFLSSTINQFVRIMFASQILLCLAGALRYATFVRLEGGEAWYLQEDLNVVDTFVSTALRFLTFIQVTSGLIPISLYVSMEMARVAQKLLMERDDDMYHCTADPQQRNIVPKVRALQLNDQLGQVTHIFTDKTGTLTCNSFEFRKFSLGGFLYGSGTTEIAVISARGQARTEADRRAVAIKESVLKRGQENMKRPGKIPHVNFIEEQDTPRPLDLVLGGQVRTADPVVAGRDMTDEHIADIQELFLAFLCCSTVDVEPGTDPEATAPSVHPLQTTASGAKPPPPSDSRSSVHYCGDSSDEVTFAYAALQFGLRLVRRTFTEDGQPAMDLEILDRRSRQWRPFRRIIAALNEYNSARAMMSVAVENPDLPEQHPHRVTVYAKGSDKRIFACLGALQGSGAEAQRQRWVRERSVQHAADFSADGFRTLAFASRRLPRSELLAWRPRLREARARAKDAYDEHMLKFPGDESGAQRRKEQVVGDVVGELERNLELQGVVGYEDSLQEGVPNAIARLQDAGITVFMLTGDKRNTALNIGYGTQMLTNETDVLDLTWEERENTVFATPEPGNTASFPSPLHMERTYLTELRNSFVRGGIAVDGDADPEDAQNHPPTQTPNPTLTSAPSSIYSSSSSSSSSSPSPGATAGGVVVRVASPLTGMDTGAATAAAAPPLPSSASSTMGDLETGSVRMKRLGSSPTGGPLISLANVHEPSILETVALLTPSRDDLLGSVHRNEIDRAIDVVDVLLDAVAQCEHEVIALRAVTDKRDLARRRADVIRFVLAIDLCVLIVKFQGGSSRPLALVLDDRSMEYFVDWPGYEEIRADKSIYPQVRSGWGGDWLLGDWLLGDWLLGDWLLGDWLLGDLFEYLFFPPPNSPPPALIVSGCRHPSPASSDQSSVGVVAVGAAVQGADRVSVPAGAEADGAGAVQVRGAGVVLRGDRGRRERRGDDLGGAHRRGDRGAGGERGGQRGGLLVRAVPVPGEVAAGARGVELPAHDDPVSLHVLQERPLHAKPVHLRGVLGLVGAEVLPRGGDAVVQPHLHGRGGDRGGCAGAADGRGVEPQLPAPVHVRAAAGGLQPLDRDGVDGAGHLRVVLGALLCGGGVHGGRPGRAGGECV
jgi:magnesium-transporting ATPase (P-type)